MRVDLTAWALWAAGIVVPFAAHAAGLSFVLRDIDGGPYRLWSPLWFTLWQPLVLAGLVSRRWDVLTTGLAPGVLIAGGLVLGSVVQLPLALIAPADAIADTSRVEILAMHALAVLSGAATVGLAARVVTQSPSARSSES